ncbi:MAG: NAD(P)/FAD-dependent oxidoreductase [Lachnospiraceae bacterium]|nr:NAD(P)/FAD-dependent oxidoreductase [Lachnospiraceae bacterium]
MKKKIVIIGGGPAGLAASIAAKDAGIDDVLIIERGEHLGGILLQCIHNGFGLHTFKEELTGPEYAARYIEIAREKNVEAYLNTMVIDISRDKVVTCMSADKGIFTIEAESIILTMGCRERPRGALNTPGYRPAGIYSAGTAQKFVNIEGKLPGKEVVILGSGDIGLIMARRMTLEGAKVKAVAEIMPYSGGLKRNIVQCLDDFGIPLKLSTTVIDISGKDRVESVTLAQVDEKSRPIPGTEEIVPCDTLLLSCGLLPENELSTQMGVELSPVTGGPKVNESLETNIPGVFAAGNVLHVHDLVDYVSAEASQAGKYAALYVKALEAEKDDNLTENSESSVNAKSYAVTTGIGVRYTVPVSINPDRMDDLLTVRFRVANVYKNPEICVYFGDECIMRRKKLICSPGEMEQVILKKADMNKLKSGDAVKICLENV